MPSRKLTVTRCTEVHRGTGKNGKEYVIYEIDALDEAGEAVTQKLNSFSELPLGELIEYDITVKEHDRYGSSFTLKRKGSGGGGLRAVYVRIEKLEKDVTAIKRRLQS